jgi:hypothetical protein
MALWRGRTQLQLRWLLTCNMCVQQSPSAVSLVLSRVWEMLSKVTLPSVHHVAVTGSRKVGVATFSS